MEAQGSPGSREIRSKIIKKIQTNSDANWAGSCHNPPRARSDLPGGCFVGVGFGVGAAHHF